MNEKNNLDQIGELYSSSDATMSVDAQILEIMARRVIDQINGPNVLEMGFGANVWTRNIITKFGHSYLVEGSAMLINKAQKYYGKSLTCYHSFFEEFTPPEHKFDTVLATCVLEHVENPVQIMSKMRDWIVPTGKILIIVPNANSIHRKLGVCQGILKETTDFSEGDIMLGHRRVYTSDKLKNDIYQAGLKIQKELPTMIKFLSNAQMLGYSNKQFEYLFDLAHHMPIELGGSLFFECSL